MLNMRILLFVALAVVLAQALPVQDHKLTKRGLFDSLTDLTNSVRNHLNGAIDGLNEHLGIAKDALQAHQDLARGHLEHIGSQLERHIDTARSHIDNIFRNSRIALRTNDDDALEEVDDNEDVELIVH